MGTDLFTRSGLPPGLGTAQQAARGPGQQQGHACRSEQNQGRHRRRAADVAGVVHVQHRHRREDGVGAVEEDRVVMAETNR